MQTRCSCLGLSLDLLSLGEYNKERSEHSILYRNMYLKVRRPSEQLLDHKIIWEGRGSKGEKQNKTFFSWVHKGGDGPKDNGGINGLDQSVSERITVDTSDVTRVMDFWKWCMKTGTGFMKSKAYTMEMDIWKRRGCELDSRFFSELEIEFSPWVSIRYEGGESVV